MLPQGPHVPLDPVQIRVAAVVESYIHSDSPLDLSSTSRKSTIQYFRDLARIESRIAALRFQKRVHVTSFFHWIIYFIRRGEGGGLWSHTQRSTKRGGKGAFGLTLCTEEGKEGGQSTANQSRRTRNEIGVGSTNRDERLNSVLSQRGR